MYEERLEDFKSILNLSLLLLEGIKSKYPDAHYLREENQFNPFNRALKHIYGYLTFISNTRYAFSEIGKRSPLEERINFVELQYRGALEHLKRLIEDEDAIKYTPVALQPIEVRTKERTMNGFELFRRILEKIDKYNKKYGIDAPRFLDMFDKTYMPQRFETF